MASMLRRSSTAALCLAACAGAAQLTLEQRVAEGECSQLAPNGAETYFPSAVQARPKISADLFDIKYGTTFKVVISHMVKEQYVLTQCGQAKPTDAEIEVVAPMAAGYQRKHFTAPLRTATAGSTVQLGFLSSIGVRDRVKYITGNAVGPCWQKAASCNSTLELEGSWGGNATLRAEQTSSVDAFFMDCSYTGDCSGVRNQANGVHVPVAQDPSPLKSAEYILFFGAFFNKDPEATKHFKEVNASYHNVKATVAKKPVVAWMQYYAPNFTISEAHYKMAFASDAGGTPFDAETALAGVPGVYVSTSPTGKTVTISIANFNQSGVTAQAKAAAAAAIMPKLASVDVLVDETYAFAPRSYTFDSFKTTYGLNGTEAYNFLTSKRVARVDGSISEGDDLDWYESRIVRPDWAVEGLARFIDPSHTRKYFRNIAENETPIVVAKDSCDLKLPVCDSTAEAAPIKVLAPILEQSNQTSAGARCAVGASALALIARAFL